MLAQASNDYFNDPVVDLGYVRYRGSTALRSQFSADVYDGISYVQAPMGQLRWQPLQNIEGHKDYNACEVIGVQNPGPSCFQGVPAWQLAVKEAGLARETGHEDCLLLEVYVPEKPRSTALPVLLYIHGGGYATGGAGEYP